MADSNRGEFDSGGERKGGLVGPGGRENGLDGLG